MKQPGLRERKRLRTQRAIREAALTLFTEQGYEDTTVEQIAELAEVATATFFRYFPGKADVVLNFQDALLPALWEAVVRRPAEESDFLAIKNAVKQVWLVEFDTGLTARLAKIIALSPPLRRLSHDIGRGWAIGVAKALAVRRGDDRPPEAFALRARVALAVFSHAVGVWIADDCASDLGDVIEEQYADFNNIFNDL
ncbi:transcriptional regulator, TetR family [Novosphingobium sp. CF614]|nr:TetR family transcriptional regulator [Novosphingobium sp. CF614]SFF91669.1 transcriptional regulator, TetR family [Novosphingobium sp. CF614]